jgi:hypothetical protein
MVFSFIWESVSIHRRLFLVTSGVTFTLLTLLDAYLYISLRFPASTSMMVAFSRFPLYLPLSLLFSVYFTVLRNSVGSITKKIGATGIFGGISAVFFTILGCPPCLFGLLAVSSSLGLLGGGLLFYMFYLQPYAGVFFTLSIVVMFAGMYLIASSSCSIDGRGNEKD